MLKAQKRLTKKAIKEDKFVTLYFQAQEYVRRNSKQIIYAAVGAVLVLALFGIVSQKRLKSEREAVVELSRAQLKYFAADYAGAIPMLTDLVNEYGGTRSGTEGKFYLANAYFQQGNYAEAIRFFKKYADDGNDTILKSSALAGVAACLEQQKDYNAAAQSYEEAARKYSEIFMAPEQIYDSARCYAMAGDKEQARRLLSEILDKYADSGLKPKAEMLLAELAS